MKTVMLPNPDDGLAELPNIGPKSRAMLARAGITTTACLRALGAVAAFAKVQASGSRPSLNLLWALEGALTGLPWREVARQHRTSLLLALEACQQAACRGGSADGPTSPARVPGGRRC